MTQAHEDHGDVDEHETASAFDPGDSLHVLVKASFDRANALVKSHSEALDDISRTKKRLAKDPTPELLAQELVNTALSLQADMLAEIKRLAQSHAELAMVLLQVRDAADSSLEDVDERLTDLENDATRIAPEDGQKLLALVAASSFMVDTLRPLVRGDEKVLAKLDEFVELIEECEEIVKGAIVDEDEEEEGDGENAPGGEA